ncbi:transmembrane protein 92-like [Rattus rattus]|uniref:transmembrane protein 92-like n=1 Tax=Rattus rattus TaxID=10117 RepID=UPI0013F36D72|nr:transmembrane protein 92-like [Rattus rattus]
MQEAWVLGTLTVIFGLLFSLQGVSSNKYLISSCLFVLTRQCPKGFRCCDNECCLERKIWNTDNEPFRILFIILLVMLPLLCICGLVRRFCPKCRERQPDVRTADHQTPPDRPSIAPLESIWVTSLDPPPPYSQVGLSVPIPNVFQSWLSNLLK